jgi:hypothetical protein
MESGSSVHDEVEIGAAILLAAATAASAWCAFQAALWSGDETRQLAKANSAHFDALRQSNEANVLTLVDVDTFLSYLDHSARGDTKTVDFIRGHARPEFRPALDDWIREREAGRDPQTLPFKSPRYRRTADDAARALEHDAEIATDRANSANGRADIYVLYTVLFAMVLFFLGTASSARRSGIRRVMAALGALVFAASVLTMLRLPRAPVDLLRATIKDRSMSTRD